MPSSILRERNQLICKCCKIRIFTNCFFLWKIVLAELTKADSLTKVADYEKNPDEWKYPDELAGVSGIRSIPSLLLSLWMG